MQMTFTGVCIVDDSPTSGTGFRRDAEVVRTSPDRLRRRCPRDARAARSRDRRRPVAAVRQGSWPACLGAQVVRPAGSFSGASSAFSPSRTSERAPSLAVLSTGRRCCQASRITLPSGSWREGQANTSPSAKYGVVSFCQPAQCTRAATPSRRAASASASRSGPCPAITSSSGRSPTLGSRRAKASSRSVKPFFCTSRPSAKMTKAFGGSANWARSARTSSRRTSRGSGTKLPM